MQVQQRLSMRSSSSSTLSSSARPTLVPRAPRRAVTVRAVQLPSGVSAPRRTPVAPEPKFGFVNWAEKINGRAAMIGFMGTLLVEAIAHRGFLELIGLTVGNGLGFEL
ncbi:hypothetical protein MNEG_2217 [Monoraphidium neglectum]|uniref:High light inducible protein n=1 Tax=Monoraphidium neglectum TaxID=145388 RepID=A0A0D2NM91_9CHLO|nr:hypothetical protein MNEG_2217 [Monoraphidium neglectum]KIZ05746.1 hypothetical protein MNEG_2217 [Monoraphidium neglectum]|eukprot:XP_013904765.1 hypothetical protein MNEG_2217 [Monoraphidium neglectum]